MFEDWKVGQTGWVRLRNGKVARAIQFGHDSRPVQIQFMKGDELSWLWVDNSGFGSTSDVTAHLPDCTGFDWEEPPKPHQWKVGDWFVVDEASDEDWFVSPMYKLVGVPQCVDEIGKSGSVKANGWYWVKEHCRPCDPPKAEPEPRFQPFIEYVGIHDAI